jgi:hypothetical protein
VSSSRRQLPTIETPVESRLYSDGLFSFSVNINRATANSTEQMLRTGRRTVSTTVRDNAEITIVGELLRKRRSASPTALNSGPHNDQRVGDGRLVAKRHCAGELRCKSLMQ